MKITYLEIEYGIVKIVYIERTDLYRYPRHGWHDSICLFCILIISLFVISKFSFARLREEHLEDMDSLSDGKKEELRELYQRPERFMNTSTFFILFFIVVFSSLCRTLFRRWD